MDWLLGLVGVLFLIGFIVGAYRGAIRIAVSVATTFVTLIIVTFAAPYVADAVTKYTPIGEVIEEKVSSAITTAALTQINSEEEGGTGLTKERVEKALKAAGIDEEDLDEYGISVEDIVDGNVSSQELAKYGISSSLWAGLNSNSGESASNSSDNVVVPAEMQDEAIEQSDLPQLFKDLLQENNNSDTYAELGVNTFAGYVGKYLSSVIIQLIAFVVTFLIVTLILRAIVFALDVVADLPVLGLVNRLAGGVIGVFCAAVVVWILFIIVTLLYTTVIGKAIYEGIQAEPYLKILYDCNPILKIAIFFK